MSTRGLFSASVVSNTTLCREHYRLTLQVPGMPESAPGQFVQISCRDPSAGVIDHDFAWLPGDRPQVDGVEFNHHEAFLRRPFSIAGRRGDEIDIIGREVGAGTRFLARRSPGDQVDILGPLGNRFALPAPGECALLVGGGVGIPPMIYLAQAIAEMNARQPGSARSAVAFAGAMTRELVPLSIREAGRGLEPAAAVSIGEFASLGFRSFLTTDDGTAGMKGFVTDALQQELDRSTDQASKSIIYTCGPEPMMKRVQQIAELRGIRCQIAVERAMACGMGTCQSCCIRVKKPDPSKPPLEGKDWCYRLACTDGPVFEGSELLW